MIKQISLFFTLIPIIAFGQYQSGGFLENSFLIQQPSARAEAMGKAYVSMDGDLLAVFYNPAGISTIKGVEVVGTYTSPFYLDSVGYYTFFGAGYRINKYLQVALTRFRFDYGDFPIVNATENPYTESNALTIASEPVKNLFAGLNVNYFNLHAGIGKPVHTVCLDFGLIKHFEFNQSKKIVHSINVGASIKNFNYPKAHYNLLGCKTTENLPVITKYGFNYQIALNNYFFADSLKLLKFLVQTEYQALLNYKYNKAIRLGAELQLFEILSIRAGYYKEKVNDYGIPEYNLNAISDFTYGLGLQLPLSKLLKIPVIINLDYTSLPQVNYTKTKTDLDNFTAYNVSINWLIKKNK